jgi:hypothetical protein
MQSPSIASCRQRLPRLPCASSARRDSPPAVPSALQHETPRLRGALAQKGPFAELDELMRERRFGSGGEVRHPPHAPHEQAARRQHRNAGLGGSISGCTSHLTREEKVMGMRCLTLWLDSIHSRGVAHADVKPSEGLPDVDFDAKLSGLRASMPLGERVLRSMPSIQPP